MLGSSTNVDCVLEYFLKSSMLGRSPVQHQDVVLACQHVNEFSVQDVPYTKHVLEGFWSVWDWDYIHCSGNCCKCTVTCT